MADCQDHNNGCDNGCSACNWVEATNAENKRIVNLLLELKAVRYCSATGKLVGFNTDGDKVIYLTGLEITNV